MSKTATQWVELVCSECHIRLIRVESDAPSYQSGARYWCNSCSAYFDASFKEICGVDFSVPGKGNDDKVFTPDPSNVYDGVETEEEGGEEKADYLYTFLDEEGHKESSEVSHPKYLLLIKKFRVAVRGEIHPVTFPGNRKVEVEALTDVSVYVDIYDVLKAFGVTCPALQHAIKKIMAPGVRGHKTFKEDIEEATVSLARAIELHEQGGDK